MPAPNAAFSVVPPEADVGRAPLVAHVPHASRLIPAAVREELLLSDEELEAELDRLTDRYTDELFAGLRALGATLFVARLSRLVFDPERFLDDAAEPAAAFGQGVVYWQGSKGQRLRLEDAALRVQRIEALYRPYHAGLDALVAELVESFGSCTLVDCHSFPTAPLPTEVRGDGERRGGGVRRGGGERPDICIGTDRVHTPEALAAGLEASFAGAGFRVARNVPFAGTFVPGGSYGREPRVRSVMIEVRRGLYLDEGSGERLPSFSSVAAAIVEAVAAAVG